VVGCGGADRQDERRVFIRGGKRAQAKVLPIPREFRHHLSRGRNQPFLAAFAMHVEPPSHRAVDVAPNKELPHRVGADLRDPQPAKIEQGEKPSHAGGVCDLVLGLSRHSGDGVLDLLPYARLEISGNPRRGVPGALS
jgi:hypothetical protein